MGSTQKENARAETWIALLGRKDVPADGIADYCECLGQNLAKRGIELKPVRIEWVQRGWLRALRDLWRESKDWRGSWVLLQFTALGWSNHGFPGGALACTAILRFRRAKCAIVFHEPFGDASGSRALDRVRCAFQNWTIRTLHRFAQKSIFTIPLNSVPWLLQDDAKSALIPIGSNIPENLNRREATERREGTRKTAVVFCVSESPHREREVGDIAAAMRFAASDEPWLRVVFVGRGTTEAKDVIDQAFSGTQIEVCNRGLCDAVEVGRIISNSDVMIAVRGRLYLRRGSALAGVACAVPIIAYGGAAIGTIVDEAGITLVPFGDHQALGSVLREILSDPDLWREMHEKNIRIQQKYLSWDVIGASYVEVLAGKSA